MTLTVKMIEKSSNKVLFEKSNKYEGKDSLTTILKVIKEIDDIVIKNHHSFTYTIEE